MKIFVSSCSHSQVQAIQAELDGHPVITIDPLLTGHKKQPLAVIEASGSLLCFDGRKCFIPTGIYWNTRPRADVAMAPRGTRHVAAFRSRLVQFFEDLSLSFSDVPQFPGTLHDIAKAESKPQLIATARRVGLEVPKHTWNTLDAKTASECVARNGRSYRKVLGPPHVVNEAGDGITTTNVAVSKSTRGLSGKNHPWQFQEIIPFVAQWRCQVVGKKVWAARWEHSPHGNEWDMRYHQEVLGEETSFKAAALDSATCQSLVKLVSACGLTHAAPEFLERSDGTKVFIDLNPCGDWMGFFGEIQRSEIAESLAGLLR